MIILSFDPGSRISGFGVIEAKGLRRMSHIASGRIILRGDTTERIGQLFKECSKVLLEYQPQEVVVESVFMRPDRPNPDSAIKLGQAMGAIIAAAGSRDLKITRYSPNQIKKFVVGRGHASKDEVSFMVQKTLGLQVAPKGDAADALAGALCHAFHVAGQRDF